MPNTEPPHDLSLSSLASKIALQKQDLSGAIATEILGLFRMSVSATVFITIVLTIVDNIELWFGKIGPDQRLVTEHVLLALIGASVVQVGAAIAAIVYALFGRATRAEDDT